MRRGNSNSPAEAGSLQTNPVVSNPLLGGGVFDPSDIPFLPSWPDLPATSQRSDDNRWGSAKCAEFYRQECKGS
jgi:hypothetical protein